MTTLDIICIVLIALVAILGYAKGAINMLIGLAGLIASFVIAGVCAPMITNWIMANTTVAAAITNAVTTNLTNSLAAQSSSLLNGVSGFGDLSSLSGALSSALASGSTGNMNDLVAAAMTPVVTQIVSGLVYFVVVMVCFALFGMLKRLVSKVNRVPVIGTANRIGGLALGVIIALVVCGLLILAVYYYAVYTVDTAMIDMVTKGILTGPIFSVLKV